MAFESCYGAVGPPSSRQALFEATTKRADEIRAKSNADDSNTEDEREMWMRVPWLLASTLRRPLPDGSLQVVARGLGVTSSSQLYSES